MSDGDFMHSGDPGASAGSRSVAWPRAAYRWSQLGEGLRSHPGSLVHVLSTTTTAATNIGSWCLVPARVHLPMHTQPQPDTQTPFPSQPVTRDRSSQRIHNYTGVLSGIAATQLTAFGVRAGLVGPQPVSSRVDSRLQQPRWLHPYAGRYPAAGAAKGSLRRPPCASLDQPSAFKPLRWLFLGFRVATSVLLRVTGVNRSLENVVF